MKNEAEVAVRILSDNEKNRIRPLYEEVFDDSQEFLDYYFGSYIKNTINFVSEINGEIVGMATIHPKELMVSDVKAKAGYVYAVATKPEYRGKGIMRSVLDEIYKYAWKHKYDYLYLIPVNPHIYEGLGYKLLRKKNEVTDISLENIDINKYYVIKVNEIYIEKCLEFMSKFYENKVSIFYDNNVFMENLQRLSINNSGIYCILDKICDRILGLMFLEDDGDVNIIHMVCGDEDKKMCINLVKNKLGVDKIAYKLHDIMFKEVHGSLDKLDNYSICINDEI